MDTGGLCSRITKFDSRPKYWWSWLLQALPSSDKRTARKHASRQHHTQPQMFLTESTRKSSLSWDVPQRWVVVTDVSGQPSNPTFKELADFKGNVGNCNSTLHNIPEDPIYAASEAWNHAQLQEHYAVCASAVVRNAASDFGATDHHFIFYDFIPRFSDLYVYQHDFKLCRAQTT